MLKGPVIALAAAALLSGCSTVNQKEHRGCLVTNKEERQVVSGSDGTTSTNFQKLVSTSCGVFEVADSIAGGWQSYDRWASIKVDHAYNFTTGGFRLPWVFPTILNAKEVA